jgi:hypothetical protein
MPNSASWDVIFGADSSQTILSVDFPACGRRQAGFAELAPKTGPGYRYLQTKPPDTRPCQKFSGAAYIHPWVESVRRDQRPVRAVLGYAVGTVYAAAIAEELSRWQEPPTIILFDPQLASIELLECELRREINSTSSILSRDEIERAGRVADEIAQSDADGVANVAAEMVENYLEVITIAFERAGLGGAYDNKSTAPFESYISWISVAAKIDPSLAWSRSTSIVSSDYIGLPVGEGRAGRSIPFDVGHADLLRSDSVARTVADLLAPGWP